MLNLNMHEAELRQARAAVQQALLQREQFVRICVLLVKAIETESDDLLIRDENGKLAIRAEAFKSVPERWTISLRPAKVATSDLPDAPTEDIIVLDVQDAKPKSTLIVPKNGSL